MVSKIFEFSNDGKLTMELVEGKLENIADLWEQKLESGKRLVTYIG